MYIYSSVYERSSDLLNEEFDDLFEIAKELKVQSSNISILKKLKKSIFDLMEVLMAYRQYKEDDILNFLDNCLLVFEKSWVKAHLNENEEPENEEEFNKMIVILNKEFSEMLNTYFHLNKK